MNKKVVIAGGTGFIGKYLETKLIELGYEVLIISRQPQHISWNDTSQLIAALNHAELLINLAGKSVNCRYHTRNRHDILHSRLHTTRILGEAVLKCENPPELWINSSTATIYRHAEDRPMTESEGEIGTGFSVDVAEKWEEAFFTFKLPHTRQVALRIAIVLGPNGGVLTPYKHLVIWGLGGRQGSGNQRFSWIHIDDLFQIMLFLQANKELSGVFNCSSPYPVTNHELMKQLRSVMNRRAGLPTPAWMLAIGARLIRTETELILKSRWVLPERLLQDGYTFRYASLERALVELLSD